MPSSLVACLAALVLSACSNAARQGASAPAPRHDPNLITAEELSETNGSTVYDAVRQLRPAWMMRARPTTVVRQNQQPLIVYVDGTRYGTLESLRLLPLSSVAWVRYLSPGNAEAQFGAGNLLGAIEVKTIPR